MSGRQSLIACAVLFIGACGGKAGPGAEGGEGGGGPPQMPPPEVSVVTLTASRVPLSSNLPGRTAPFLVAEVRPQVGGLVLKQLVQEGADVKAGDVLYQIDPASFEVALTQAKANLMRAEAGLGTVSSRSRRYDALVKGDAVSLQDRDDASGGVRSARADVASARAAIEAATLDLSRTEVRAPVSGRVMRGAMKPGSLVVPFQSVLCSVQQLDPIYVDIIRPSVELLKLRRALASGRIAKAGAEGSAARVTLVMEDDSVYAHEGRLEFADALVDPGTGAVTLRAVFPNPEGELLPGMYVRARLDEGVIESALLVPQQGVTRDPKGQATALVVGKDGMVQPRVLEVDRTVGDQWLVLSGLAAGDQVIVEGLQKVRPGAPAKAVPYDPGKAAAPPGSGATAAPPGDGATAGPPGDAKPGDAKPGDAKPGDAKPDTKSEQR